ncbi:hypothetical protein [Kordiimonas aquimaris]|uniref:hypothetical protein n=1 Tax=Kordiimonas aquimaris TaxID=707591 RepID=UPI0021CECF6C|nr:hypothetical protein [Kordiimonas aquimaris]
MAMLSKRKILSVAAATFVAIQIGGYVPTIAQDDSIKELLACDKIKDPADKLECFNAAIEILKQEEANKAEASNGNLLKDRPLNRTTTRNGDFGFSANELARRANKDGKAKPPKQQIFTFTRAWQDAIGKYYFLMSNGQVWKEIGGSHLIVPKRAKTIRIKRNALGGYNGFVEGMNGRRGSLKRIR